MDILTGLWIVALGFILMNVDNIVDWIAGIAKK